MNEFIDACFGRKVDRIPVWFMRQAGRSLPGYRALRKKYGVLELAQTPELAAHVSLEPISLLGVDAAILFADIMLLPIALGVDVAIVDSVGPVLKDPIDTPKKIHELRNFDPTSLAYLAATIKILRAELAVPLIGFSGAPFTLASYLIEGKPSRTWTKTKRFMIEEPRAWNELMRILSKNIVNYLRLQIDAGAQAVQLFDSWVGALSPEMYRRQVLPHVEHIFASLQKSNVPRLHFGTNTAGLLRDFASVDAEVIGLDWRVDIAAAKKIVGPKSIQGNLEPTLLLGDWRTIRTSTDHILSSLNPKRGFIFNFGHGVLPETDDRVLKRLVEYVHNK